MMINFLNNIYLKINMKFPKVGLWIKRLYKYKIFFNNIHKKVSGSANHIHFSQVILNNVTFDIKGNQNTIEIRQGAILNNVTFFIRGDCHQITIGEECVFSRGGSIWFEHNNGSLIVGKNTTMENAHIAVTEPNSRVSIGEDCMFAYDIDIRTGDSHSIIDKNSGERINYAKNVNIGNHVWLASHCRVLKGVSINNNSVVATGAIVTKTFNENGIILAGNPAKIVKQNITWDRENIEKTT